MGKFFEEAGCTVKLLQRHNLAGESPGYPKVTDTASIQKRLIDAIQPFDAGYSDRGVIWYERLKWSRKPTFRAHDRSRYPKTAAFIVPFMSSLPIQLEQLTLRLNL